MNRKQKIILILTVLLPLVAVTAFCFWEWGAGNTLDIINSSDDESYDIIVELQEYDVMLEEQEEQKSNRNEPENIENNGDVEKPANSKNHADSIQTGENTVSKDYEVSATVETIKEKYEPRFKYMEDSYEKKLHDLIMQGINEYNEMKKNGENISKIEMGNRYYTTGRKLEAGCDKSFEWLLGQMEEDLKKASLPQDLIQETRQTYKDTKDQRRQQLLDLAKEHL